ncbi:MAG: hypothetical protein HRU06_07080 [Oceanospirillaceae bacterium]|nr:hypothetical protein [Oceanospirillaceae bacterium]
MAIYALLFIDIFYDVLIPFATTLLVVTLLAFVFVCHYKQGQFLKAYQQRAAAKIELNADKLSDV